jgi:octaprenyl-diphosphate synthase
VAAAHHLVARGGKRVRPITLLLSAKCFGSTEGRAFSELAAVVELAHSATLLHDDVIDEGMERRGAPTSRRVYGNGISVLSGDLLLVNALSRTQRAAPELVPELISTLRQLVEGEIIQLKGRTELDVSEATYERILKDKTASLFAFSCRAGALLAGASAEQADALAAFGEGIGIAFQLVDDVIDYDGSESGKTLFADLLEGKLTLPLVLAIQGDPTLKALVAQIHGGDESVVAEVSRRVVQSGSCEEVRARARAHTASAIGALRRLPESPARKLLEVVALEMTKRTS